MIKNGSFVPVTVLSFPKMTVLKKESNQRIRILIEGKFHHCSKLDKPNKVAVEKFGVENAKKGIIKEVNIYDNTSEIAPLEILNVSEITKNEIVDVSSISKGKGFCGVMKRWNFKGGRASHGNSLSHRTAGSTGQRQDPGRVHPGHKMAGRHGADLVTQQNLEVLGIEDGIILIKGSIPGSKGTLVKIKRAVKKR